MSMVAVSVVLGAPARGQPQQQSAIFEWSIPSRFGSQYDSEGRIVEARPDQVTRGPWRVDFQITGLACTKNAVYRWTVDGKPVEPKRLDPCSFRHRFPAEGSYEVRLDATAAGTELTQTQQVVVQDWLIVSIGDSVASGEAVPDVPSFSHAIWQSVRCHRSARAATAKAAKRIEDLDSHSSVTFVHLACSGATVPTGLLGPYAGVEPPPNEPPLEPQVTELNRIQARRPVDAVLLSVGANDVHFGDIVRFCSTRPASNCFTRPFAQGGGNPSRPAEDVIADSLRDLPARYDALDKEISPAIPRSRVHIVEYFDPTHDAHGDTCKHILGFITAPELELAQSEVLVPLNEEIAAATARHGWDEVTGVADRFRDHGYCAGRSAWVTTLSRSFVGLGGRLKGRILGTLHPNEAGHEATSELIAAALQRSFYPGQVLPTLPEPQQPDDDGLPALAIVMIAAAALAILATGAWLLRRRRGMAPR